MLSRLNGSLVQRSVPAQFVSVIYGVWDDTRKLLRVANSGLPRPIYCRKGRVERVEIVGLPLGLFEQAEYEEATFRAQGGDLFVFFSDGIVEAINRDGEMFGRKRLEEVVEGTCDRSANDVVDAIFRAVAEFTAGEEPYDDQTVVALKVTPRPRK
jgi:sigma-B regulation protein RsbU (phosphoserine phosphatase)